MDGEDAVALEWMAKYSRTPYPREVVWKQDDVLHDAFYWLSVPDASVVKRGLTRASIKGQTITVESEYPAITIWLNDLMLDLDKPVRVQRRGKTIFEGKVLRTVGNLWGNLNLRGERAFLFPARIDLKL
jgi:hypothetical protein